MMGKFIELHNADGTFLINTSHIISVYPEDDSCIAVLSDGNNLKWLRFKEKYDVVRHMIAVAQGGIPMRKDGTAEGAPG